MDNLIRIASRRTPQARSCSQGSKLVKSSGSLIKNSMRKAAKEQFWVLLTSYGKIYFNFFSPEESWWWSIVQSSLLNLSTDFFIALAPGHFRAATIQKCLRWMVQMTTVHTLLAWQSFGWRSRHHTRRLNNQSVHFC